MDQSRSIVLAAGAVSLAASLFAIGAAVSSDDDGSGSAQPAATEPEGTQPAGTEPAGTEPAGTQSSGAQPGSDSAGAPATTALDATPAPAGEQVDIAITDFAFGPGEATVAVGTEVVWTNNDGFEHNIVFPNNEPAGPGPTMVEGDTYSVTFTEPGTYSYICGFHPQMRGTIVVEG